MLVLDDNPAAPVTKELEAWAERELKRLKAAGTVETAHLPAGSPQARALSELLGLSDSHSRKGEYWGPMLAYSIATHKPDSPHSRKS